MKTSTFSPYRIFYDLTFFCHSIQMTENCVWTCFSVDFQHCTNKIILRMTPVPVWLIIIKKIYSVNRQTRITKGEVHKVFGFGFFYIESFLLLSQMIYDDSVKVVFPFVSITYFHFSICQPVSTRNVNFTP